MTLRYFIIEKFIIDFGNIFNFFYAIYGIFNIPISVNSKFLFYGINSIRIVL
jgi:hypothetical protein